MSTWSLRLGEERDRARLEAAEIPVTVDNLLNGADGKPVLKAVEEESLGAGPHQERPRFPAIALEIRQETVGQAVNLLESAFGQESSGVEAKMMEIDFGAGGRRDSRLKQESQDGPVSDPKGSVQIRAGKKLSTL